MFLRSDDVLLRTVAFGPGPRSVLALNGWSAAWEAWQPTFELLSASMRCVSYDTRGTGDSPAPAAAITLSALVDDVIRVADAHALTNCVLAGESLGGFVALNAVLRAPTRFAGLVLVDAPPEVTAPSTARLVAGARADYRATVAMFARMCLGEPDTEHLLPWAEGLFLRTPPGVAVRLFEACYGAALDLAAVAVPTVVVHGTADQVVPIAAGRALAAAIPGARLVELHGAGHAPTVTRPAEVAAVIRALADTIGPG
jgi:pimeloyl-ACP methyl ester carboxylesterase